MRVLNYKITKRIISIIVLMILIVESGVCINYARDFDAIKQFTLEENKMLSNEIVDHFTHSLSEPETTNWEKHVITIKAKKTEKITVFGYFRTSRKIIEKNTINILGHSFDSIHDAGCIDCSNPSIGFFAKEDQDVAKSVSSTFILKKGAKYQISINGWNCYYRISYKAKPYKNPKKVANIKTKIKKDNIIGKWKKILKADGYQTRVSLNKNFKKHTYELYKSKGESKKRKSNKFTFPGKKGKTYYVKVRAYRRIFDVNIDMITMYGKWSKVKKVKIK